MTLLINPVIRWAVHPADTGTIDYIDGMWNPTHTLPHEGETITRPFLVDPQTKAPIPVRVVEIRHLPGDVLAVIVARADRQH